MKIEYEDYTVELIEKWKAIGHLTHVKEKDQVLVAQRLEAAHRRTFGEHANFDALKNELKSLSREGFFN